MQHKFNTPFKMALGFRNM